MTDTERTTRLIVDRLTGPRVRQLALDVYTDLISIAEAGHLKDGSYELRLIYALEVDDGVVTFGEARTFCKEVDGV
jgi:hypothetical protein